MIDASYFHSPTGEAIARFGQAAASRANTAMHGLERLIRDRSINRFVAFETRLGEDWDAEPIQALRGAIFALAGSRFMQPDQPTQAVRNDIEDGEPGGTIIVKGQADKLPLFVVESESYTGGRRIEVLNGQLTEMDAVMQEVNAFSPEEARLARKYLNRLTIHRDAVSTVLGQANRYTTPQPEALHAAFQYEIYGGNAPSAWLQQMDAYEARRGKIPE